MKKALFIVPFFNDKGYVGNLRVKRYLGWLAEDGYSVDVISSGENAEYKESWGRNIAIRSNSLLLLSKLLYFGEKFPFLKPFYLFVKIILKIFLIPDEERLWANKVSKKIKLNPQSENIRFVFSSSPLESAHVAGYKLSKRYNLPHIVDMRDGWMDESLKLKFLTKIKFREKLEGNLERDILENASLVFVTTESWQSRLSERYPKISNKVFTLTNAYPDFDFPNENIDSNKKTIDLYYTGRFTGSSIKRRINYIFEPFLNVDLSQFKKIQFQIYSDLRASDLKDINRLDDKLEKANIEVLFNNFISREKILSKMSAANGLILLSASNNAIPAKFFEYLKSGKPVLAITYKNNAVWKISENLPQFFLVDINNPENNKGKLLSYLNACNTNQYIKEIPEKYSSENLGKKFLEHINHFS